MTFISKKNYGFNSKIGLMNDSTIYASMHTPTMSIY